MLVNLHSLWIDREGKLEILAEVEAFSAGFLADVVEGVGAYGQVARLRRLVNGEFELQRALFTGLGPFRVGESELPLD